MPATVESTVAFVTENPIAISCSVQFAGDTMVPSS